MKSLIRNINVFNILLTAALTFFVLYTVSPLSTLQVKYALPEVNKQEEESPDQASELQVPSPTEFMTVSDQNLFHPERKIPVVKKEEQPLPKPDLVLYGTLITDTLNRAYVEDLKAPRSSPGRGKRQTAAKQGDIFNGFILKEIYTDRIVLVRGEEKLVVAINDSAHPKDRAASATIAAGARMEAPPAVPGKVSKGSPGAVPQAVQPAGDARRTFAPSRQPLRKATNPSSQSNSPSDRGSSGLPKN